MAGKNKFFIPTLEEMEKEEASMMPLQLFKPKTSASENVASMESSLADVSKAKTSHSQSQGSPTKRLLSQKALMSMQPLSKRVTLKKSSPPNRGESLAVLEQSKTMSCKPSATVTSESISSNTLAMDKRKESNAAIIRTDEAFTAIKSANEVFSHTKESILQDQKSDCDEVRFDALPTLAKLGKTNSLVVNQKQRGNPILKYVRNVPWEFGNIVPDYVLGQSNCALFLSLRYHQLHPEYIHTRLKQLGHSFDLRVLLVQVDLKEPHHLVKELAKISILADCTLMLAFSVEEAGRYLETYKVFENKAAEALMERTETDLRNQVCDCLTRVKSVNRTDCATLLSTFGSMKQIVAASVEDLSLCPGFGPQKARRLKSAFTEPFLTSRKHHLQSDASSETHSPRKSAR